LKVIVAKSAGFCFGVTRAVERVYEEIEKNGDLPVYTYGPIIHNEIVVEDLEKKGVRVIDEGEDFSKLPKGVVILRSHGVSEEVYNRLIESGHQVVDATCPFVKKIHRIVSEKSAEGQKIIIAGNPDHPEVSAVLGWCKTPGAVVQTPEELEEVMKNVKNSAILVAQTTFNHNKFENLVAFAKKMRYNIDVVNTICNATRVRQLEACEVAAQVDCMLVIGGRHSSNTQKLYEICKNVCAKTYYLQTVADIDPNWFDGAACVGITAGASTPNNILEEVQMHVRNEL
jgi:4-hydroxy-3-methylbut-2-enyl diphosphate reductase